MTDESEEGKRLRFTRSQYEMSNATRSAVQPDAASKLLNELLKLAAREGPALCRPKIHVDS